MLCSKKAKISVLCVQGPAAWRDLANHKHRWYVAPLARLNECKWSLS